MSASLLCVVFVVCVAVVRGQACASGPWTDPAGLTSSRDCANAALTREARGVRIACPSSVGRAAGVLLHEGGVPTASAALAWRDLALPRDVGFALVVSGANSERLGLVGAHRDGISALGGDGAVELLTTDASSGSMTAENVGGNFVVTIEAGGQRLERVFEGQPQRFVTFQLSASAEAVAPTVFGSSSLVVTSLMLNDKTFIEPCASAPSGDDSDGSGTMNSTATNPCSQYKDCASCTKLLSGSCAFCEYVLG